MIHVRTVAHFARDGRVWRSFDHLMAVGAGRLLMVPVGLADGDLTTVIDGCPIPWQEAWAVLDADPAEPVPLSEDGLAAIAPTVAQLLPSFGWERDVVPAAALVPTMIRLRGPEGLRFAMLGEGDG